MLRKTRNIVALAAALALAESAHAAMTLNTTRVIFDTRFKEASLEAFNRSGQPILLQSWLESDTDAQAPVPFAVSPPLAKMPGESRQKLRVLYQGSGVPGDRESVFWLNVQEIPQSSQQQNVLQLAIRQRIKVFYRPPGLQGTANEAPAQVAWQLVSTPAGTVVRAHNPSAYHVNLAQLKLAASGYAGEMTESLMIRPGETRDIAINVPAPRTQVRLDVRTINDFGASVAHSGQVNFTGTSHVAAGNASTDNSNP